MAEREITIGVGRRPDDFIPYVTAFSVNQMYLPKQGGGKYLNPDTKAEQIRICYLLRGERARLGQVWEDKKTYVKIIVYRPDMRSDPSNFEKAIVDGIKLGIDVDDRWYEVETQWKLDSEKPRIEITVWQ